MTLLPVPALATPRLCLRPLTISDTSAVYEAIAASRAQFNRWFVWSQHSTPQTAEDNLRISQEAMLIGSGWHYGLFLPSGFFIGRLGLADIQWETESAELGYWLRCDYAGHGFMTEACRAVITFAFEQRTLHRISAYADTDNTASQRVLTKLGFRREGTLRHAIRHPERGWRDHHAYGLLEGELS